MLKIRPVIVIGIGPQAQRTVQGYVRLVRERQGNIPALLPAIVDYAGNGAPFKREREGIQYVTLSSPLFEEESVWPTWLPPELSKMPPAQRERTRAWMRAALLQKADDLQEFLLERIPRLSSFATVEALNEKGLGLAGSSEVDIYVVADLSDHLGSGIFVDVACLTAYVCRQLGLIPLTSGLLYLPNATSPAPMEEAIAYAALKELEYYSSGHPYDGELISVDSGACGPVPFDGGCCLLDSVNEIGYTLQDEAQLTMAACEQLYAMTFLNMATAVQEQRHQRYQTATLRGKARVYESLGIAIRYVPRRALADWAAARLGASVIERILNGQVDIDPEQRARAFIERVGLRPEVLESVMRSQDTPEQIERALASLCRAGIQQVEGRAREVLQTIRGQHLPALDDRLGETGAQMRREVRGAINEEVQIALADLPAGGMSLIGSTLDLLRDQVRELRDEIQQRAKNHQRELGRSLGTVSETYYALRNVTMGMPPWSIALLSAVAVLILPLLYEIQLILRVVGPLNVAWMYGALGILAAGVLGVLGFVAYRLLHQKRMLAEQHVRMVRERFELESRPLVRQEIGTVYDATLEAIAQAKADLDNLGDRLRAASAHFQARASEHARRLQELTAPGPFRSAVDLGTAERFYQRAVPDLEPSILVLTQQIGPVSEWLARSVQSGESFVPWLCEQIAHFGDQYLEQSVRQFKVAEALSANGAELRPVLERMLEHAHPLWNYDPRLIRRAKTQRLVFVGADTEGPAWPKLAGYLAQIRPEAIAHHTGDPTSLAVLNVHLGVPLFALRRIGQYRSHYAEVLWRGKLPIHTTSGLALADDLIPLRRRTRVATATLFATGLALGIIHLDPDGRYIAPRARESTMRLSAQKERSVALMGMDAAACREVQARLNALVAKKGPRAVCALLDEYVTTVPDLADWEVKRILDFCRACKLDQNSG